jgi:hypothetical protein
MSKNNPAIYFWIARYCRRGNHCNSISVIKEIPERSVLVSRGCILNIVGSMNRIGQNELALHKNEDTSQ